MTNVISEFTEKSCVLGYGINLLLKEWLIFFHKWNSVSNLFVAMLSSYPELALITSLNRLPSIEKCLEV